MGNNGWMQPPRLSRWLLRGAAWLAPSRQRAAWRRRWDCRLEDWWILVERGELAGTDWGELTALGRLAWADAWRLRVGRRNLQSVLRGPWAVVGSLAAALAAVGACSRGFGVTRFLWWTAAHLPQASPRDTERLIVHCIAFAFAAAVSLAVYLAGHRTLPAAGLRYWSFLGLKSLTLMALTTTVWIEGGAALRSHVASEGLRVFGFGLLLTLGFVGACGYAAAWNFADQCRRCPVCLRRLGMPVSLGSWSSIFDPPATEMVCEMGHGSLYLAETETAGPEQWVPLDDSWQDLFEHEPDDQLHSS